jgi:hypothetical protein
MTTNILEIGNASPQYAGNIVNTAAITQAGSGYATLILNTTGAISNGGGSIGGTNLVLLAGTGIGTAGTSLATQVSKIAFRNQTSGVVNISNSGALTIANLFGFVPSFNNGTTTTVTAASPLTIAADITSAGNLNLTAGESGLAATT